MLSESVITSVKVAVIKVAVIDVAPSGMLTVGGRFGREIHDTVAKSGRVRGT
jgi:hypothetical protein